MKEKLYKYAIIVGAVCGFLDVLFILLNDWKALVSGNIIDYIFSAEVIVIYLLFTWLACGIAAWTLLISFYYRKYILRRMPTPLILDITKKDVLYAWVCLGLIVLYVGGNLIADKYESFFSG